MSWRAALVAVALTSPAGAAFPPPADICQEQSRLSAELRIAPDEARARAVQDQLWRLWTSAPGAATQQMLDRGMKLRGAHDLAGSRAELDALVAYCPDFAEGYNQRAFFGASGAGFRGPAR